MDVIEEIPRIVGNETPSLALLENPERLVFGLRYFTHPLSSLRARYGQNRIQNGIHISLSAQDAIRELQFFFPNSMLPR